MFRMWWNFNRVDYSWNRTWFPMMHSHMCLTTPPCAGDLRVPFLAFLIRETDKETVYVWHVFLPIFRPVFLSPHLSLQSHTHSSKIPHLTFHWALAAAMAIKLAFRVTALCNLKKASCTALPTIAHTHTQALERKMDRSTDCKWHVNFFSITHGRGVPYQSKGTRAPAIKTLLFFFFSISSFLISLVSFCRGAF